MATRRGITAVRLTMAIATLAALCVGGTAGAATSDPARAQIGARYALLDTASRKHGYYLAKSILAPDYIETDIDGNREDAGTAARHFWDLRPDLQHIEVNSKIDTMSRKGVRAEVHATSESRYTYTTATHEPKHSGRIVQRTIDIWEYRGNYWFLVSSLTYEQTQWLDGKIINHEVATGTTEPLRLGT